MSIDRIDKDDCSVCNGERGGVKGNEQWIKGIIACDYCCSDIIIEEREYNTNKQ